MDIMNFLRGITNANQFAGPSGVGNFGDMLQGIGHDMAQHGRYGQSTTPDWALPRPAPGTVTNGMATVPAPVAIPGGPLPPVMGAKPPPAMGPQILPGLPGMGMNAQPPVPIAALPSLISMFAKGRQAHPQA
jgi:hypothetical protein